MVEPRLAPDWSVNPSTAKGLLLDPSERALAPRPPLHLLRFLSPRLFIFYAHMTRFDWAKGLPYK